LQKKVDEANDLEEQMLDTDHKDTQMTAEEEA